MKLLKENYKSDQIRRHYVFFINFLFSFNILKEKNLNSSLFLCKSKTINY